MVGIMEERRTIKMKNSVVTWHGYENYNMNCNIEDLKKKGFECSSYNNDLAPSYTNKKGNIQVFFIDLNSDEMKAEKMTYKFSVMKLDEHGEYSETIGTTNSFEEMLKMVKEMEKNKMEDIKKKKVLNNDQSKFKNLNC